jgi:membrane-bound lytic murein transglycosylase MltF
MGSAKHRTGNEGGLHTQLHAGVKYIRFMVDKYFVSAPMTETNKLLFAFAAYNAQSGRIRALRVEAAQKGLDPNVWVDNVEVIAAARVGMEPVNYAANIRKYYIAYKLVAQQEDERSKAFSNCDPRRTIDFASAGVGPSASPLRSLLGPLQASSPPCVGCR